MALRSLTTTPTPSGTETVVPAQEPGDTNANSGLLGPNGPQPLVPAFILSGLLIVGIFMMCWWKRLSARRVIAARAGAGAGAGVLGEDDYVLGRGRGGIAGPVPRINMVIGAGRGIGAGMIMLAAHGTDLRAAALEGRQQLDGRRKKEVKLGPKPVLWDVHLETEIECSEGEKDLDRRWRWRDMRPLSASPISTQPRPASSKSLDTSTPTLPSAMRTDQADTSKGDNKRAPQNQRSSTQYTSPLRISVLISMPTPRERRRSGHTSAPEKSTASSVSEEILEEALEDTDSRQGRLGDLNLVLGITEVPLDQKKL